MLACSLAACSTSANDAAGPSSPSPAVSLGPPDQESCGQASGLALLATLRMAGVGLALEMQTQSDAAKQMTGVVEQVSQTEAKVTHGGVKAVVAEYRKSAEDLQKQLDTAGGDKTKLASEIDGTLAEFEQAKQKLGKVCEEPGFAPNLNREANCEDIKKATIAFAETMFGLLMVDEDDSAKLAAGVAKLAAGLDAYVTELGRIAIETGDSSLRAAIVAAATDMTVQMKKIPGVAKDYDKLGDLFSSDSFSAEQEKMAALCPE
jgi:hypothetical protein